MTQGWTDIANSTLVVVWGANPTENHPACMAHVNRARFPQQFFTGARAAKTPAKLVVIDPRRTRTAVQADMYVRIRPGTDIALANGLTKYVIDKIESGDAGYASDGVTEILANYNSYLNQTSNGTFFTDGSASTASASVATVPGNAKYTDARFLLNAAGDDYDRHRTLASDGLTTTAAGPDNTTISDFPKKAATANTAGTVYRGLKSHVAHYTTAVVADICGCTEADIETIGDLLIANSRHASYNPLAQADATNVNYRSTTILYAMGITQHTCGSANVKSFAVLQGILGNMGRAGGGINALRGIHNVQGSTDMGLLYGNIPAYSGNPSIQFPTEANAFGKYMDGLWGLPLSGTGTRAQMNQSYDDAYNTAAMQLQQRGFYNMTLKFFGDYAGQSAGGATNRAKIDATYALWPKGNGDNHVKMFRQMIDGVTKACVVWGQNPAVTEPNQGKIRTGLKELDTLVLVDLFETETAKVDRKGTGLTFLFPAAAYPEKAGSATNSGRVLQWRYQGRTAPGNTKDDTQLLFMLAEKLDSAGIDAFSHIADAWEAAGIYGATAGSVAVGDVYKKLYAAPYLGAETNTWATATVVGAAVEAVALRTSLSSANVDATYAAMATPGPSEIVAENIYREMCTTVGGGGTIWLYTEGYDLTNIANTTRIGNAAPRLNTGYTGAWNVANRAKSRGLQDAGQLGFHMWGYSWLVNRRVFYNNGEVIGDQTDFFMSPDSVNRLFAPKVMPGATGSTNPATLYGGTNMPVFNYSRWYRTHGGPTIHVLYDMPKADNGTADGVTPAVHVFPGRFPSHVEPYETPRPTLAASYGYNTTLNDKINTVKYRNLIYSGTDTGVVADYPLVLTTIRCVEHFQGGPITRNNALNVEIEPEPWIELNSVDARKYGIRDKDWVNVITARGNSTSTQLANTPNYASTGSSTDNFGKGFRARVGVGTPSSQRVEPGVVAIPWHWGDAGLSTGSRANDLCIDAMDANTTIPESKACLCKIVRIP